eukprot:COSAG06_NODE_4618_length_4094_cov_4.528779_4_plen_73_part_00
MDVVDLRDIKHHGVFSILGELLILVTGVVMERADRVRRYIRRRSNITMRLLFFGQNRSNIGQNPYENGSNAF